MNKMTTIRTRLWTENREPLHHQAALPHSAFPLLGESSGIIKVKQQLIYASHVRLPVFITGEIGTEKRTVAHYIHQNRHTSPGRFVFIPSQITSIEEYKNYLDENMANAVNGTIFLAEIDKLSAQHKDYLTFIFSNQDIYRQMDNKNIQLIVSCTDSLTSSQQFLSKILGNSTPHLELHIPPLSQRKQDIPLYIDHFLTRFGGNQPPQLGTKARQLLCDYSWPQNVSQLQKVMMVLISSNPAGIDEQDVLALEMIEPTPIKLSLIDALLTQQLDDYQQTHPALHKSLKFLSEHYREEVSLQDVADSAYTSPSHLSFLFRQYLTRSFKAILVELRVQFAKQLIVKQPHIKITDVCLQSGFGDLSHFEKMFKRYVNCTPRQFRTQQRQSYQLKLEK